METITLIMNNSDVFIAGIRNTVVICVVTFFVGCSMAVPIGLAQFYRIPIARQLSQLWIYVFRATPLLILTYLMYYGLAGFEFFRSSFLWPILRNAWWCAIIALSINTSAYMAEIFRVAFESVPKGEIEAAVAAGLKPWQKFRRIEAPRAFGIALPMIGNEAIFKVHGSAIISTITIVDVLGAGQFINARYYLPYEGYVASAIIYFVIISSTVFLVSKTEAHMLAYLRPRKNLNDSDRSEE